MKKVKEQMTRYKRILKHYGKEHQMLKAVEEMAELTAEILRYKNGRADRKAIFEEMADTIIMLTQLAMIMNIKDEELASEIEAKLDRTIARMVMEKE